MVCSLCWQRPITAAALAVAGRWRRRAAAEVAQAQMAGHRLRVGSLLADRPALAQRPAAANMAEAYQGDVEARRVSRHAVVVAAWSAPGCST